VIGGYWRLGIEFHLAGEIASPGQLPGLASAHPAGDARSDRPAPGAGSVVAALRRARHRPPSSTPGIDSTADLERLAATLSLQPGLTVPGGRLWLPAGGAPAP
jgi:hypothetical protein